MTFIKTFKQISKSDVGIAGGKGASLGEMTNAGVSIPPGFIILSDAFEKFLEKNDLDIEIDSILRTVDLSKMHTIENASEKIHALIIGANFPNDLAEEIQINFKELNSRFVAVRSSATAEDSSLSSWAGQLESYLNTPEKHLLKNIKKCWASLFTPRAIFYRFENRLNKQKISVAVVVQKMINSEISGIAFSVHPITQDNDQLIIEAGFGLGEAMVSGQITPDSYVVEKKEALILDINVFKQKKMIIKKINGGNEWVAVPSEKQKVQKLSGRQIIALAKIIVDIEKHYNFPCDIEWAMENSIFYITQSRPITTLI